jgi:hypothetical protein
VAVRRSLKTLEDWEAGESVEAEVSFTPAYGQDHLSMGPVWLAGVDFLVPFYWSASVVRLLVKIPKQNGIMVFSLETTY